MSEDILVICDEEVAYARCILDYLEEGKMLPFAIMIFTKTEELELFSKRNQIEILLIAQSSYHKQLVIENVSQLFILQENEKIEDSSEIYIKKYQPISNIVKELRNCYYEKKPYPIKKNNNKGSILLGFYSPVKRCLQTSFALILGQLLGNQQRILYLNLEAYSGYSSIFNQTFSTDLSDIIYSIHNQEEKFLQSFMQMVVSINGFDMIPPAFSAVDLSKVACEEWLNLFRLIRQYCDYDYIILDLSDSIQGLFPIMRECDKIITIGKDEELAKAKLVQYENMLLAIDYGDILEKMIKVYLPYLQNHRVEINHLVYSRLTEYVEVMIGEQLRV